jgi:hypothetical protein
MPVLRLLLLLAALVFAADAHALRCGNRIVTTGDRDFQVIERCGEPFWTNSYSELHVTGLDGPVEHRAERVYEEWFYNFGPRSLVQRLVFADGRLVKIESAGYGEREIGQNCDDSALRSGATAGEVVLRCGPPRSRNTRYEDVVLRDRFGNARVRPVRREEWIYDFGRRSRFVRMAVFVDGRLDRVERIAR